MNIIVVLLLVLLGRGALAQTPQESDASPFHAGVRADYLQNYHHTDAICPTCGTYSDGKGSGYLVEVFGELPFNFFRRLNLTFGAGFADRGGEFGEAFSSAETVLDPYSNKYVPLVRVSSYSAHLRYLNMTAGLRLRPVASLRAYVVAAFTAGIPLGSMANYSQDEQIVSPDGVLYPGTNTRTKNDGSGTIPGIQTAFGITTTVGYEVPLSRELSISPELSYYHPLGNVESGFLWRVRSFSGGFALRWSKPPVSVEPPPLPLPKVEPPVVRREDPNALAPKLSAVSLASEPYHIIETTVTETFPILPYIFFDSASSALSDRLARMRPDETSRFKESELPHRSLESYYNILNILGNRLRMNPAAILTINGTTDGKETGGMAGGDLAQRRAQTVRDYFVDIWGIAPERLRVATSDVPHNPSSSEYAEGLEENRRVELSSNDDQILKPIVHARFQEESASPKALPFRLTASSKIGVRDWHIAIRSHGSVVYETSGTGEPGDVEWHPTDGQVEALAKSLLPADSLYCDFEASATNGARSKQTIALPASKSINPFELSRLSLIVFDFDQSAINRQNQRMISLFVAKSIYPVSTSTITGSTDNLGELRHNEKLSADRAFNVRDLVIAERPDAKITSTKGIGPSNLLYDNHLPEGRYYCRTVRVEVETPLDAIIKGQ